MRTAAYIFLCLFLLGAALDDARKANEAYRNGNYEEAIKLYKNAVESNPENPRLLFNLGNALAKAGQPEEALRYFEQFKSMTDDPRQKSMADYNMGKIFTDQQQWDKALEYYKNALRFRADDPDAKYNYELARKKQQEQQKQQQQNQNSQDQNQQQQNGQQKQDQDQQNRQQQQQPSDQNQDQSQQPKQQQPQTNQISQAEAEKILKALEQKEKELLKEFKKQKTEKTNNTNGKDW